MSDVRSLKDIFNAATGSYIRDVRLDFLRCKVYITLSKELAPESPRHLLVFAGVSSFQFLSSYSGRPFPDYDDEEDEDNHIELMYIEYIKPGISENITQPFQDKIKVVPPNIYIEVNESPVYLFSDHISYDDFELYLDEIIQ